MCHVAPLAVLFLAFDPDSGIVFSNRPKTNHVAIGKDPIIILVFPYDDPSPFCSLSVFKEKALFKVGADYYRRGPNAFCYFFGRQLARFSNQRVIAFGQLNRTFRRAGGYTEK